MSHAQSAGASDTRDTASILSRVEKILRKTSEAGCSPQEAATAFAHASRLLTAHNLTMEDVKIAGSEASAESADPWEDVAMGSMPRRTLQQSLGTAILRDYFFVQTIWTGSPLGQNGKSDGGTTLRIFGKASNVAMARFVFGALMRSMYTLWEDYRAKTGCAKNEERIFMTGVAQGFRDKLKDERAADEAERDILRGDRGGSTALVLMDIAKQTMEKYREAYPNTTTMRCGPVRGSNSVFSDGHAEGRKLSLNRAVGGKGQGKLG